MAGRGEMKKAELKEDTGTKTRETKSQNPPAGYYRGGWAREKGENQHEMERWHNPQSRKGGEVPS